MPPCNNKVGVGKDASMNYIEKMLQDYCPNGVEWKELGEVCNVVTDFTAAGSFASNAKNVKYLKEPDFAQLIRTTDLKSKFQGNKFIYVDEHAFNYLHRVNLNEESLILPNVGNCGELYYLQPSDLPSDNNVLGPNALLIRSNVADNRYLYHLFLDSKFQSDLEKITSKTGQTKFNKTNLKKILIPIPPLEIQEEIVKILDKFTEFVTELTAELTAELTDRQKQYTYYRDKLLSFEDEVYQVEWKTLGELFDFKNGLNKSKEFFGTGTPIVNYTDVYRNIKLTKDSLKGRVEVTDDEKFRYSVKRGDVFFTRTSETQEEIGKASVLLEEISDGVFSGFVLRARPKTELLLPEYCAYCFASSEFRKAIVRYSTYTTRALTNGGTLSKLEIPIPSLDTQSRIVQVLDNFDTVCNDLNIGLPKEIELRQKQYEYFRDKLLTFTAEGVYTDSTVQYSTDKT